ncbi:hypothetical protein IQ283_04460 [Alkalihalobacillus hwajinpoensis]|nr:hypothetical protein [Pseudalkalibacillus hwajinpoensis]
MIIITIQKGLHELIHKKKTISAILASTLLIAGCSSTTSEESSSSKKEEKKKPAYNVEVADYHFDTFGNMFAYAEFELSGEPLAESLGLDLDVLDSKNVDSPTPFDYTAGIESYEYSEEAMYEVVEKSGLGLHLINGPVVKTASKETNQKPEEWLSERFLSLADSVGYPQDEIFRNMYPTTIEYSSGDPHYAEQVDTEEYASGDDDTYVPNYQVNFDSLRWDRDGMDKVLTPSAYGATFLKQTLWAGDFLGGFHTVDGDEELAGETAKDDDDENIALGVSSADGMQGMILTEEIWNKINFIHDDLFYDSTNKEASSDISNYDPTNGFVYLPHEVSVTEKTEGVAPDAESLEVTDTRSLLEDQWAMLWPTSEFFGMTDQRSENKQVAPSFQALFDGEPFTSAPEANLDADPANDEDSNDAYSVNRDIMLAVFHNIDAMHFNQEVGTFVSENNGQDQGQTVNTFDAGYTVESLRIFQRAIDGLPVGYASGEDAEGLGTDEGKRAIEMITKQADFIMKELILDSGLAAESYDLNEKKASNNTTLEANLGAIRGLTAAYLATDDAKYRDAARHLYVTMDNELWNDEAKAYYTSDEAMSYSPKIAGAVSAVLRNALLTLNNTGSDQDAPENLEREIITQRYTDFYNQVIDGPALDQGMQASEFWDTGDFYKTDDDSGNTDGDMVPQIQAGHGENGISPVLVPVEISKSN